MSGELGLAGYRFQYHVIVWTALELWTGPADHRVRAVDSIRVEGRPEADKVDYELIGQDATEMAVVQVKSRWGTKTWSPSAICDLLLLLSKDAAHSTRLELVANGTFSGPARDFVALLADVSDLDDRTFVRALDKLNVRTNRSTETLAALRRSSVTVRSEGLAELSDRIRTRLRKIRAMSGMGLGDQAAELLLAYLLRLAMNKAGATDPDGRALAREEFLSAVAAPQRTLEEAFALRWGVPGRIANREHAIRRTTQLTEIGAHLKAADGTHATDGHVRVCVLAGPAGIGKTTLAQTYALDNASEFDWIYHLTAGGADDESTPSEEVLGESLEEFAIWLDCHSLTVPRDPKRTPLETMAAISEALARSTQSWLLIIDNVEAAETVTGLLPPSGYGTVLITTRNSAWNSQQPVVKVGALTITEAYTLVRQRLRATVAADDDVAILCEKLENLPLSLVTATGYLANSHESVRRFLNTFDDEVYRLQALDHDLRLDDYALSAVAAVNLALRHLKAFNSDASRNAMDLLRRASVILPDKIPANVVQGDATRLNSAVALLQRLSLIDRWQDNEHGDWIRLHRIIQDVVRADLETDRHGYIDLLRQVELLITDLMAESIRTVDLTTAGALRMHAITLAARLKSLDLQTWEITTALLANAGFIAQAQGNLVEAEELLEEALSLIPPGNCDSQVAGRRGKTLTTLAMVQSERGAVDSARVCLAQARDAHDLHRHIPAHGEALVECTAMLCRHDARAATTADERRAQFDIVHALPDITPNAALARMACLVRIARDMHWDDRTSAEFTECGERLLELVEGQERRHPLSALDAHLCLAEVHGVDGGVEAAWRHYRAARDLYAGIPGIDPTYVADESLEFVLGLLSSLLDETTGFPYRDIDRLIRRVLDDLDQHISTIRWEDGQRHWIVIKLKVVPQ